MAKLIILEQIPPETVAGKITCAGTVICGFLTFPTSHL